MPLIFRIFKVDLLDPPLSAPLPSSPRHDMHETEHIVCQNCGAVLPPHFTFCGRCGHRLYEAAGKAPGERRQITVVFCDLVGSVPLSHLLDPEDFASVVRRYQEVAVEAVEARGGYVAQYLGDGILAYFGYPVAGEHTAEDAVRAGLKILSRMSSLRNALLEEHGLTLSLRIGVHTGIVVVDEIGSGAHRERLALGETPNVAARIQSLAPTDTMVVSRETYRLISKSFRCADLGPQALKGLEQVQHVYQVIEERHGGGLVDRWMPSADVLTVGRDPQIGELLKRWSDAAAGAGGVVVVTGEPGVGKSHITQVFRSRIGPESHYCVSCRCAANLESSPFHPLVEWLGRVLNFYADQPLAERVDMLEFVARRNGLSDSDVVPLLTALFTNASFAELSDLGYSPSRARARTEEILEDLVLGMGSDRPLLFVMEDVQWIDPSTRNFLVRFAEHVPSERALLLLTARSRPALPWPDAVSVTEIVLDRLEREQIAEVILDAAGGRRLPDAIVERILEKADGVPLYAQEFTKMVVESGALEADGDVFRQRADLPDLAIPSTLQDSLMARLDRLMPVKEVAQICSVLGRSFTMDLAAAATGMPVSTLDAALDRLVDAGLLAAEGVQPKRQYAFRHTLLQEAAYQSILKRRRAVYHRRVARHLIDHPGADAARPDLIAHHLSHAGDMESAATYWCRAGEEAQQRWANEEAIDYFERGLALVETLPSSPELRRLSLQLNVGLAAAALQQKGYSHPDVAAAFERAAALASDLKDAGAAIPAVLGLWSHYSVLGDHTRAEVLAERLAKLAQLEPASLMTFSALSARAFTWFWQGDIGAARKLIESLLVRFGDLRQVAPSELSFQHPVIGSLSYLSLILWCQGESDRAVEVGREAIRTAEAIGHPFSLAFACGFNSVLDIYLGDVEGVRRMAARTIELSEMYGFPFWHSVGQVIHAWAKGEEDPLGAVAAMNPGLEALRVAGVKIWTAYPTVLLSELLARAGRLRAALATCEEVLSDCELQGEFYFMPELRRLRARMLDEAGEAEEASREREYALTLAQRQRAAALALRVLNDMMRYEADPSPQLREMLRRTAESMLQGSDYPDLAVAMEILSDASESPLSTSGRA